MRRRDGGYTNLFPLKRSKKKIDCVWNLALVLENWTILLNHSPRLFFLLVTARFAKCTACAFTKGQIIPECCIQKKIHVTSSRLPISKSQGKRERLKEKERDRKGESTAGGFLVSALCALAWLGPSYASVPQRASALHRQTNTHTHSQLGLPVILDSKRGEPNTHFHKIMHSWIHKSTLNSST